MAQAFGFDLAYRKLAFALLSRAPSLAACAPSIIQTLVDEGHITALDTGQVLSRRGEPCDGLNLVVEGAFEISVTVEGGLRHMSTFVLPGTLLGLISVIDQGPRPHDVIAHTASIVLHMPLATVRRVLALEPAFQQAVALELASRSRRLYDALTDSLLLSLRERLSKQLIHLAENIGLVRDGQSVINLKLPQSDLADLLGAGRQSVNRELRDLQAQGLIKVSRTHITVLDLPALKSSIRGIVTNPPPSPTDCSTVSTI